jgi:nitrogen PTS system EIIA component
MKITTVFKHEYIISELKSATKEEALFDLASVLPRASLHYDLDAIVKILMEREKLGSTGIGDGIAIPHGKLQGLGDLLISFGRSKKGVLFDAMDGKPVHLFFLLIAPEHSPGEHLKALAKISRMLKDDVFRKKLLEAKSRDSLYTVIAEKDEMSL